MDSMEDIYRDHAKTVYGFLLTRVRDSDTAEELTQETFYRAVKQFLYTVTGAGLRKRSAILSKMRSIIRKRATAFG